MVEACPTPDEILRWVAGHLQGTPRGLEIGNHVLGCTKECPGFLDASYAVVAAVVGPGEDEAPAPKQERSIAEILRAATSDRKTVQGIFAPPSSGWLGRLRAAQPMHDELLYAVADRAVWHADEDPERMREVLELLRDAAREEPEAPPSLLKPRARALVELAHGVTRRTEGDHLGALACYARAEQELPEPALELEHPYINLARGASLRRLKRYAEARAALELARAGFARNGVRGESKALWELTNIAWETGDVRGSFRLGRRAYRLLLEEGYDAEAPIMLQSLVAILIDLRRPGTARKLLRRVQADPAVQGNPNERARSAWNAGMLAAAEGDLQGALTELETAAARFAELGAVVPAARAALDVAHVAGARGDTGRQTAAAAQAAAILERVPGQEVDYLQALAELKEALGTPAALAGAVVRLRRQIRPL